MVRPASKLVAKFLAATVISALLFLGLLGFRLMSGPVSLSLLQPIAETVLNDTLTQYRVRLGDTEIAWSRSEQTLDLLVHDAELRTLDGRALAKVPQMAVRFSARALALGTLAPGEVDLIGPSATLLRREDGGFQFGFSAPGTDRVDEGTTGFFTGLVSGLRGGNTGNVRLGYLDRFTIKDANLTLYDAVTHSVWHAPKSLVSFSRTRDGLQARLAAQIGTGNSSFAVTGSAMLPHGGELTTVTLSLSGLDPSKLAAAAPSSLASWSGVQVPLRGDAMLRVDAHGEVQDGAFWLFAGSGPFAMPGLPSVKLQLVSAEVKGTYNAQRNELSLERLSYRGEHNSGFVSGKAVLERGVAGDVTAADFNLTAKDVVLDMPTLFAEPGRVESVAMSGRIEPANMHVTLASAELHAGEAVLTAKGEIDDRPEGLGLKLDGTIDRFAIAQFAKLWPLGSAQGARDWILKNVTSGVIRDGVIKVDAAPGAFARDKLDDKTVQLTFAFDGMSIDYLHGLTPITGGAGHAKLSGNRFDLAMEHGAVGTLVLTDGRYVVPDLADKEVPAEIAVNLKGDTKALLGVLDMQPLAYPSSYGFRPDDVGGSSTARIALAVPMKKSVRFADIALKADLVADALTLPPLYRNLSVEGGTLNAQITNDMIKADGVLTVSGMAAKLAWTEDFTAHNRSSTNLKISAVTDEKTRAAAGVPFADRVEGPVPLTAVIEGHGKSISSIIIDGDFSSANLRLSELNWAKPRKSPATAHFAIKFDGDGASEIQDIALQGSGLDIRGKIALDKTGAIRSAAISPLRAGPGTNARVKFDRENGASSIELAGEALDLSRSIGSMTDDLNSATPDDSPGKPLKLSAALKRLTLANGVALTMVNGRFSTPGYGIGDLALDAAYENGGFVNANIEKNGTARALRIRSADMGKLLRGLDLTEHVQGGSLILDANLPAASSQPIKEPLTGTASLKGFRVKNAPALAKLLTVASFGGIKDLLTGEGIAFESLDTPFSIVDKHIALGPGRAFGPSIGLTIQGDITRGSGDLDLSGTLVPAYALNSFLGNVPVIGNIFVSREGEGVIGMTYAVKGDAGDPHVMVNPLSALAPGFLRRIFELDEANTADRTGAIPPKTGVKPE